MPQHKNLVLAALLAVSASAFAEPMSERPEAPGFQKELTRAEFLERASEHFQRADTNNDGVLSADERKAARKDRYEKRKEHREPRRPS